LLLGASADPVAGQAGGGPPKLTATAKIDPAGDRRGVLRVESRIAEGWHVNSHTPSEDFLIPTVVSPEAAPGVTFGEPEYPPGKMAKFSFSKKPLSVYEREFTVRIPVSWTADATPDLAGAVEYQACNDTQCLPPDSARFSTSGAPPAAASSAAGAAEPLPGGAVSLEAGAAAAAAASRDASGFQKQLSDRGYLLMLLSVFIGGLALNLTPCVYPVIPLTIGFFGGQAAGDRGRVFRLAALYVLGIVAMYSALGVAAALSGKFFGALLQNPWVLVGIAAVLVALALSMFGLYDIQPPAFLMQKAGSRTGAAGALAMGLLVGVVAAPCVAPFTLGLLAFVAETRSLLLGALFFGVLALGLGLPYLFLAAFSGSLSRLPRAGAWMNGVKKIFGWLLLAMAAYFLRLILPEPFKGWLLPGILILGALWLVVKTLGLPRAARLGTAVLFLGGAFFFAPRKVLGWQAYSDAALAAASGKPALIDFTADWCIPCVELDQRTFSDSRVRAALSGHALFKADMTRGGDPQAVALTEKFAIRGVPTVIFLDASGNEIPELRLVGFEDASKFLKRLESAGTP
jgi:thiol:disulfide interchange protein DsbD